MQKLEEEAIVEVITRLGERALALLGDTIQDMADNIQRERGEMSIGKNKVQNFIKQTRELRTRWILLYEHQRAV